VACLRVPTPVGTLTLVGGDAGLRAVLFGAHAKTDDRHPLLVAAAEQLGEYFARERTAFDLPLDLAGTPFQRRAWLALAAIPYGTTRSYGEQARVLGRPGAARAVGAANGRNPLPIVLPCHRLVGSHGELTGYGGGLEVKRALLELEGVPSHAARSSS
jgi:methylated-DNA-[protein]-cysteine S-methyltransferase